jgi:hypothetical protein
VRVWPWLLAAAISAVSGAALSIGLGACSSTVTTPGVLPLTSIVIRSSTLTSGLGCGTAGGQVYKYAAVVQDPALGAVYDCYADAAFANLAAQADGGGFYTIDVFLYDEPTYNANAAQINAAVGATNGAAVLAAIHSTYQTTCTGTLTLNLQTIAQCNAIPVGSGSLQITTNSFALSDGGTLACNSIYDSVYSGAFDGGFLSDAGAIPSVLCPNALTIGPFPGLTPVNAPVTLVEGLSPLATTICHGTIVPSASTPATCDPLILP